MKLLLDAHTFLWFVWDEAQLTKNAKALIVNPTNQKFICVLDHSALVATYPRPFAL